MRFICLSLALLAALPTQALAAGDPAPEYQVELVLFLRDRHPGGEYWQADTVAPDPSKAVATVLGGPPPSPRPDTALPVPATGLIPAAPPGAMAPSLVTSLPVSDYELRNHAEALRRKGLTPLLHTAWRQRVGDRDNQDWLWLNAGPMRGLVRISLGRFLHIDTDLALKTGQGDSAALIHSIDHRRLRSGELHYLDHPAFGMLVLMRPYQPASSGGESAPVEAR